jgi:two-component system sensor histidine kinase KdpD
MTFITVNAQTMYDSPASPNCTYIRPARRGKHKIFIGMAPGVGKTCKMLDEAHRLKQDGIDVVIGWIETHNRQETAAKAIGLEVIPRKIIEQDGLRFSKMDLDAILERQPQLVLVDELVSADFLGLNRGKHYEDIEVILAAGISVYSTINIQHLESLSHLITEMTGIVVQEHIPDRILDEAAEVVVVDITPETLEERLLDGKIYPIEKMEQSLQNLFQHRNLVTLREIALREVANKIEKKELREAT